MNCIFFCAELIHYACLVALQTSFHTHPSLFSDDSLCNIYGNCLGLSLDLVPAKSEKECLETCKEYPGKDTDSDGEIDGFCNWYTFRPATEYCELYMTCERFDDGVDYVSGNINCDV